MISPSCVCVYIYMCVFLGGREVFGPGHTCQPTVPRSRGILDSRSEIGSSITTMYCRRGRKGLRCFPFSNHLPLGIVLSTLRIFRRKNVHPLPRSPFLFSPLSVCLSVFLLWCKQEYTLHELPKTVDVSLPEPQEQTV